MSENPKEKKLNPLQMILKAIITVIAACVFVIREPLKNLYDKTYRVNDAGDAFRRFIGILTALALGISRGYLMSQVDPNWQAWLLPSIGMALLGFGVIVPGFYLTVWKGATEAWKYVDTESEVDSDGVKHRRHKLSWLSALLTHASHLAGFVGALYTGWCAGNAVAGAVPIMVIGGLLGIVSGIVVAIIAGLAAWAIISAFNLRLIATIFGVYTTQLLIPTIQSLGLSADATWAVNILAFFTSVGYIFPALHVFVSRGFKKLVDRLTKVYDEENHNYRDVVEHTYNILEATYLAVAVVGMAGALAVAAPVIGGVVFLVSYIFLGQVLTTRHHASDEPRNRSGWENNGMRNAGALFSAHYGWFQGANLLAHGTSIGTAIGLGALHAVLAYVIIAPLALVALRFVVKTVGDEAIGKVLPFVRKILPAIGNFLVTMYDQVIKAFDDIEEIRKDVYNEKPSTAKTLVLHVANLFIAYGVVLCGQALCAKLGLNATLSILGGADWFSKLHNNLLILPALLSYLVVGRILTKEKIRLLGFDATGMMVLGLIAGLTAGIKVGVAVLATSSMAIAVILGLLVGSLTTAWLAPAIFAVAASLLTAVLPRVIDYLSKALSGIHEFFWAKFKGLATMFVNAYRWVKSVLDYVRKTFRETYESVRDELNKIFKRNKSKDKSSDSESTEVVDDTATEDKTEQ